MIDEFPKIMLAPLAGVSDWPFRRICQSKGADLCFVEMISAQALLQNSGKTLEMLARHPDEKLLGVQLTGRAPEEMARAVNVLDKMAFDCIDINMGCPVKKVVQTGCGSAILRNLDNVYQMIKYCRNETDKPLTVKIRIGWDRQSINAVEVAQAAEQAGASWLTVHGRTRADDYSVAVDLHVIKAVKQAVRIPVIGNGNIFDHRDMIYMIEKTAVDGVMISRGALGDPWIFTKLKNPAFELSVDEWLETVMWHVDLQLQAYGPTRRAVVCMRKHLLWYLKGFENVRLFKEQIQSCEDLELAKKLFTDFVKTQSPIPSVRKSLGLNHQTQSFHWQPKRDMDKDLDRGIA